MKSILHRKDKLIITTLEIIDEIGIMNLSTREIASREGVSEATLFRHYRNKNDLLMAVLDYFTQFDNDLYQTTMLKKLNPLDAIRFFLSSLAEFYENYPAITVITQLMDTLRYEPELEEKVRSIVFQRSQLLLKS
ncbi:MAG: TetR/AcrR family transcriptional regulator [Clostridiales bacterium]|nr:TetR/AcrR family transcriptional regulator [Clostridiales bacterium]